MIGLAGRILGSFRPGRKPRGRRIEPLAAEGPVYAVGDVHGCRAELRRLLEVIGADAESLGLPGEVILLGDMVDRGSDSAGVLQDMMRFSRDMRLGAILGNHEAMMLDFFAAPKQNLEWLHHGGFETLLSYGLSLDPAEAADLPARRLDQMLRAHVPQDHLAWLSSLPWGRSLKLDRETFILAHAGYSPDHPLEAQPELPLLWGPATNPAESHRLVHGHVIVDRPDPVSRCIAIDTGAWKTGLLSAVRLWEGDPVVLTSRPVSRVDEGGPARSGANAEHEGRAVGSQRT